VVKVLIKKSIDLNMHYPIIFHQPRRCGVLFREKDFLEGNIAGLYFNIKEYQRKT